VIGALGGLFSITASARLTHDLLRHVGILQLLVKVHLSITSHIDEPGLSFVLLSYPLAQEIARILKLTVKLS